jgi:hypothetical protein
MKFRAAAVLAMLAMGCGSEEEPQREFTVLFEEVYGECAQNCYGSLRVTSDGEATASRADTPNSVARTRAFTLTEAELAAVTADVESALGSPWNDSYGCPDCNDQGAYTLELDADGDVRETTVDPRVPPAHLAPLTTRLNALLDANEPD